MTELTFPHIFLPDSPASQDFTSPRRGRDNLSFPARPDRAGRASYVRNALEAAWENSRRESDGRKAISVPFKNGTYIEFESAHGFDLKTKSLDLRPSGIRLLNVATKKDERGVETTYATIFVPEGKENILLKKVEQYRTENTRNSDNPKNKDLIDGIENLREAVIESFWRDESALLPRGGVFSWCEVWLRCPEDPEPTIHNFIELCASFEIEYKEGHLSFPERSVVLIKASDELLRELILSSNDIAEFRMAKETAEFWMELDNSDQTEWVESLADRVNVQADSMASLCVIDTGVNNGHILLEPVLSDIDCHTVKAEWGAADQNGHGTLMCGVAAYGGELDRILQSDGPVEIPYILESVKLIPAPGQHHSKELYGLRTKQAISRAEVQNPDHNRTVCLAITSMDDRDSGRPSSWSGSLDQLASGAEDERKRLLVVAGGNIDDPEEWKRYPSSNITNAIHDPGQAWNALTVGSYTLKTNIADEGLAETYSPIAAEGELSPFSATSQLWDSKWPNKPEIVFEGGNAGIDADDFATELDDLSILTTNYRPHESQLAVMNATSASSAQAANMASKLRSHYPDAWPETIRALMVHSAQWPEALWDQFADRGKTKKQNIERMLRTCGYGVPNYSRALESAQNSLTLIAEEIIQPFGPKETGNEYRTQDMHLYELPWPIEALAELPGETEVRIDVTLSYFIEPSPGEVGWRNKYTYRSHGLDFNIKGPLEDQDEFVRRLNEAARSENDDEISASSIPWVIGTQNGRTRGSIHRDWWITTARDAMNCNVIGVFPRTGWWKERHHLRMGEKQSRYSLIVSLSTPETEVDIYTPIAIPVQQEIII